MAKSVLELRVYLKEGADPVGLQLRMLEIPGVKDVRYVSKTDGAKWLEKMLGVKDIFASAENPLPDTINIKLKDNAKVQPLVEQVQALPGVDEVKYSQTFVEFMLIVVRIILILGVSMVIIIGLVVIYIIINTIRLTVFARRKEIEIMKLVGATDWFIRWPFLLEGIMLGLGGALVSFIVLSKGYHLAFKYVKQMTPIIPLLTEHTVNGGLMLILGMVGLVFGAIGSMLSIKKFLRV
jgi:cell division transport system permease protein